MKAPVKSMTDFARDWGISRATVRDIVKLDKLPVESMQHGKAKGLNAQVQKHILKKLGIPQRPVAAAS